MDGGGVQASRPAPAGQYTGRGRSPGAFFLGCPATGIRRRGPVQAPPGTLSVLSACRVCHQLSYRPGRGPAGRVTVAILFSLPRISLISAWAWNAGSPFFLPCATPARPRVTGVSETASFCSLGPR
ncbi:hypothetical protein NDU88_002701 [Pleurodeles waltl]|uniref:Uncharacterized protein n=1 Tax=Pleurodeles waltl TaxID=8319 RepID=A0AAV7M332_PLEWA|nr:hypothetical protein NDU88_002701 [Pleurodeles waltl]